MNFRFSICAVQRHWRDSTDVRTLAQDGTTPLMVAAGNGHVAIMKSLIEDGANIRATNQVSAMAYCSHDSHRLLDTGELMNGTVG